jgi:hypothetical protein
MDHQANIYKKKIKNSGAYSTKSQFYGIPFTFINLYHTAFKFRFHAKGTEFAPWRPFKSLPV